MRAAETGDKGLGISGMAATKAIASRPVSREFRAIVSRDSPVTSSPAPSFNTGYTYVALMVAAGVGLGILFRFAGFGDAMIGLGCLLAVALVFDVVVNRMATQGMAAPLEPTWRFSGFLAGALLHIGLLAAG